MGPVGAMPLLLVRNIASDVESAPSTFSSWDKCMQKAYCKWPVIVGIVVGAAILIAIAWCLISCICCGVKCCTGCLRCCSCCCPSGGGGGGGGGGKRSQYADDPSYHRPPPPPSQGYQAPAAPTYRGAQAAPNVAQFATFETPSKKVDDDALPPMPSWETALTRKIEDTSPQEDVEMDQLRPSTQPTDMVHGPGRQVPGGYNQVPSHPTSPQPGYHPPQRAMEQVQPYPPQQYPQQSRSPGPGRPYPPQQSGSPGPGRPYGPPLDTSVGVAYPPQQSRSPGPGRPYGTPVDSYIPQPELRGDAPYQNRRQRAPSFHRPQPYGQNMSPVSPPRAQPPYGGMQRRPTYASDTAPPSYTTEPPQQGFAPGPVPHAFTPEQRQPSLPVVQQAPYQNTPSYATEQPQRQPTYATYQQPQQAYAAYSPPAPSSPPPNIGMAHSDEEYDSGRPPSLLQAGPRPGAQTRY